MQITELALRNVKSYGPDDTRIVFLPGINLIWGENGSGKSTILEAIGYALFGAIDYSKDQFLREGESGGEIVLSFLGKDGRPYQIVRKLGSGSSYIFDPTIRRRLTRRQEDVDHWLTDEMGVELGDYGTALFRNAIGVPQGSMTGTFLMTEKSRKAVFDELLKVTEYRAAYEQLVNTDRHLRDSLGTKREEAAGLRAAVTRMPAVQGEVDELQGMIAFAQRERMVARTDHAELLRRLAEFDAAKTLVETLARTYTAAQHALATTEAQVVGAQSAAQEAEEAALIAERSKAGHLAYRAAFTRRDQLLARITDRDREREQLNAIDRLIAEMEARASGLAIELGLVARAEARLLELEPLVAQQTKLELQVADYQQLVSERKQALIEVDKAHQRAVRVEADLAATRAKLEARSVLEKRLASASERHASLIADIETIDSELASFQSQRPGLAEQLRAADQAAQELIQTLQRVAEAETTLRRQEAEVTAVRAKLRQREACQRRSAELSSEQARLAREIAAVDAELTVQQSYRSELMEKQRAADRAALELAQAKQRLTEETELLEHQTKDLQEVQVKLAERQDCELHLADLAEQYAGLTQAHSVTTARIVALQTERSNAIEAVRAAERNAQELAQAMQRVADEEQTLVRQRAGLAEVETKLAARAAATQELDEIGQEIAKNQAIEAAMLTEIRRCADSLHQLDERLAVLRSTESAECPVCRSPLDGIRSQHLESEFAKEREALLKERQAAEDAEASAKRELGRLQRSQRKLQESLLALPVPSRADELQHDIREQQAKLDQWQARASELAAAGTEVAAARSALTLVDEEYDALEAERKAKQDARDEIGADRDRLNQQIASLPPPARANELALVITEQRQKLAIWHAKADDLLDSDRRAAEVKEALEGVAKEIELLSDKRKGLQSGQAQLDTTREEINRQIADLPQPARVDELQRAITEQQTKMADMQMRGTALSGAEERRAEANKAVEGLEAKLAALAREREGVQKQRGSVESERQQINGEIATLPLPSHADQLASEIILIASEREEWKRRADALSEAPGALAQAQEALAGLDDPRTERAGQQAIASRRAELEKDQSEIGDRMSVLQEKKRAQLAILEAFATLDNDLEQVASELAQYATDDRLYMANEQLAGTCAARQRALEKLRKKSAQQEAERAHIEEQYQDAVRCYDEDSHRHAKAEEQDVQKTVIRLEAQLDGWNQQLVNLQGELKGLQKQQESLSLAEVALRRLARTAEVFRWIRQNIRDAGPQVVHRRVQVISYQANHIFQDIVQDPALTISWDDTYAIIARCKGEERAFKQLSGGEQMAAAIALRLALLMQMSDVRILFLDEPTANLDDKRRDRLADRITQVEGLQQIFVITHDDAFQRDTHHVIHVVKNGVSRVEGC